MSSAQLPTYYLSHGGGPWPYMKQDFGTAFDKLEASLQEIRRDLGARAHAVLVISGHWEEPDFTVSSGERPGMVYDYYGFPDYTYRIKYGAPGSPELAAKVQSLLQSGGIRARSDADRGFDHGTFSLMQPLYPEEQTPLVQLSLQEDFDPGAHLRVGRLLAPLREEGVLIVGSGSSYRNLRRWGPEAGPASRAFDDWLQETLTRSSPVQQHERLAHWTDAPSARAAHPREEHLLPLMVAVGAAEGEPGACVYRQDDFMGSVTLSSFRFGA